MIYTRFLRLAKLNIVKVPVPTRQFSNLHIQKVSSSTPLSLPIIEKVSNVYNPWIYQQNGNINLPRSSNLKIDLPNPIRTILPNMEPTTPDVIKAPALDDSVSKEAVKMIVIRRKKMKKHKLRKLRKRMKFEWAKKRQRRELKKEKAFQAELIQQCKEAETFSAEQYIQDEIKKFKEARQVVAQSKASAEGKEVAKN